MKKTSFVIALSILLTACTGTQSSKQQSTATEPKQVEQLDYISVQNPEDLVQIPNTKWIISSGMAPKSGLHLLDSESKSIQRWIAPKATAPSSLFPESEPQPDADHMQIHGISLRQVEPNKYYLYAVNHHGEGQQITRETIEIFEVNTSTAVPTLTWLGALRMPNDIAGNGVVSGKDGSIYVTVMLHPENTLEEMFEGKTTGAVYCWTPTTRKFEKLQGTEFSGNNGIEISEDNKYLYIVNMQNISKVTNTNPVKIVATTSLDYGGMDNLHWQGEELITAGSLYQNCGEKVTFECLKDFHITLINPDNLEARPIIKGKYNNDFSGVSTVLAVGNTYYLGSFYRDRMAYFEVKN